MKRTMLFAAFEAVAACVLAPFCATAQEYFVATNGDDAAGECRIAPPEGSKAPDFKPVDAKRLGKPVFVDQEFPAPLVCRPKMP